MNAIHHKLYTVPEVTYGTVPTSPAFAAVRHTSVTLGMTKTAIKSTEIRADRQVADVRHGNRQVGGNIEAELTYLSLDTLLAATLCGTWSDYYDDSTTTATSYEVQSETTIASAGGDLPVLLPGDTVTITGFTSGANNVVRAVVAASTVNLLTLSGTNMVTEASGDTVTITVNTQKLALGTTRRSYTVLRHFSDQSSGDKPFHVHTGVEFNSLALSVKIDSPVTASFACVGRDITPGATAPSGSTYGSPNTNKTFVGLTGSLSLDGTAIATVTEVSLNVENGLGAKFSLFNDKTAKPSIGQANVSGSMTVYFENATLLERFYSEDDAALEFYVVDEVLNRYTFTLPRIKLNGGQPDATTGPIVLTLPFQAVASGVNVALQIRRN